MRFLILLIIIRLQSRVADPDPDRVKSGQWILIQEGKNDSQK
jgi:hypothetical protein